MTFSCFKFVLCYGVFKAPFAAVMPSSAAVPSKSSRELLFYSNVALIQYCELFIGSSSLPNPLMHSFKLFCGNSICGSCDVIAYCKVFLFQTCLMYGLQV